MIRVIAFAFAALSLAMSTAVAGQAAGARLALMSPAHGKSLLQPRPALRLAQVGEVCRIGTIYCEMHDIGTIGTTCCGCGFCGFWSDD